MEPKRVKYGFERYSNIRMAYGPSYSSDGKQIVFISDLAGVPQLWSLFPETGRMDQITFYDHRISTVEYSPTEKEVVFSMDPGGSEKHQLFLQRMDTLNVIKLSKTDDKIYSFGDFSPDGKRICYSSNERDDKFFDVYTQSLISQKSKLAFQSDHTNNAVGWLGNDIIIMSRFNTNLDNDLYLLDNNGKSRLITEHKGEAYFSYAGRSNDSSIIYSVTDKDQEISQPSWIDVSSGKIKTLDEEKEWEAFSGDISPDNRFFSYMRNVDGASKLHLYDLNAGRDIAVSGMPVGAIEGTNVSGSLCDWRPDSHALTFTLQGPTRNMNLWNYDLSDSDFQQITHVSLAGIARETFVEPEHHRYRSFDGLPVPVLVYRPHDASGPLRTVVYVHGGPEAQETVRFNIFIQFLVNDGFLVLAPNVRGSAGYGKRWVHLDDVEKRLDSVKDLEYLVKWAVSKGLSAKDKVSVLGGSYGGFMVLSALTEHPDLWAAGVDMVGIADFETFLENTAKWRRHLREPEYGSLEKDRALFKRISPIHHVERIKAALLVIHGANDPRVPVGEADQIVERLKKLGRHVEYLRFEDEGHGVAKIRNRIKMYEAIARFLEQVSVSSQKEEAMLIGQR